MSWSDIERERKRIRTDRLQQEANQRARLQQERDAAARGRADLAQAKADNQARVKPAVEKLQQIFREVERNASEVRSQPRHDVTARIPDSVYGPGTVQLRWGNKFEPTDTEAKHLSGNSGFSRRPETITTTDHYGIHASVDAQHNRVEISGDLKGKVSVPLDEFMRNPDIISQRVAEVLENPYHFHEERYRSYDYGSPPPPDTSG